MIAIVIKKQKEELRPTPTEYPQFFERMISRSIIFSNYDDCPSYEKNYYQKVVFINKSDVESYEIFTNIKYSGIQDLEPIPYYRIEFKLKEGRRGFCFQNNSNSIKIKASFGKEEKNNKPKYKHKIELLILGINEHKKQILNQFDNADDYFAVLQHSSGVVEVYAFFTGLKLDNYSYEEKSNLNFNSYFLDNYMPFAYESENVQEEFNNSFHKPISAKDFNNDYNDDYL